MKEVGSGRIFPRGHRLGRRPERTIDRNRSCPQERFRPLSEIPRFGCSGSRFNLPRLQAGKLAFLTAVVNKYQLVALVSLAAEPFKAQGCAGVRPP
jgi:hypothetical protein